MATVAVRVSEQSYRIIRELAEQTDESLQQILADAIETYRRTRFLEQANDAFGKLRANEAMWKHEQAERALWTNAEKESE
ncbi:MAG TPA: toxin-antitoxin system protein [Thermoanaerobaculia bacterium]|nr:toxin-antitoxin system protein [Thermoanaerobaculia bacterium]